MLFNQDWDKALNNTVSTLLLKAADQLEKHGHAKHALKDYDGRMCFLGALEEVGCFAHTPDCVAASTATCKAAGISFESPGAWGSRGVIGRIVDWNNQPARTGQEVIDAMRAAALIVAKETA